MGATSRGVRVAGLAQELTAFIDPVAVMRRVAEQTCAFIPHADGSAVTWQDGDGRLVVLSAHGALSPRLGLSFRVEDTFNAQVLQSMRPTLCRDVPRDERIPPHAREVAARIGMRSYLAVPLIREGRALGVLSVCAAAADAFDETDVAGVASMRDLISTVLGAGAEISDVVRDLLGPVEHGSGGSNPTARFLAAVAAPELAWRDQIRAQLDVIQRAGGPQVVFQPIYELRGHTVDGFEALSRFPGTYLRGPDQWFQAAHRVGRGVELEILALRAVLSAVRSVPDRYPVGVNLSPTAALDPGAQDLLLAAGRPLVLELTEHEPAPRPLGPGLRRLREAGIRLAVDDTGAGFAGLTRILHLRPDILKLDRALIAGMEHDPVRRTLAGALVGFAAELGASTVAEGIETQAQRDALRELGVQFGQGYWLGRPRPWPDLAPTL